MSESGTELKKLSEVITYLRRQGYVFGKTKIYDDHKKGLLTRTGKGFKAETVLAYAKAHLKLDERVDHRKVQARRIESQARKEAAQAELIEMKTRRMKGELIPVAEFEKALVQRAVALKSGFVNLAKSDTAKIIRITAGDRKRTPELKAYLISEFERLFDDYARNPVLEVPVAGGD